MWQFIHHSCLLRSSVHSSFDNTLWSGERAITPSGYNKALSIWYRETSSLRTASGQSRKHKSPLSHTKRLHTRRPSGTDFGSQKCKEKVQLSWKINYLIISQNPILISDWRGNERVPLLKHRCSKYLLLFWHWHFPLCSIW